MRKKFLFMALFVNAMPLSVLAGNISSIDTKVNTVMII